MTVNLDATNRAVVCAKWRVGGLPLLWSLVDSEACDAGTPWCHWAWQAFSAPLAPLFTKVQRKLNNTNCVVKCSCCGLCCDKRVKKTWCLYLVMEFGKRGSLETQGRLLYFSRCFFLNRRLPACVVAKSHVVVDSLFLYVSATLCISICSVCVCVCAIFCHCRSSHPLTHTPGDQPHSRDYFIFRYFWWNTKSTHKIWFSKFPIYRCERFQSTEFM